MPICKIKNINVHFDILGGGDAPAALIVICRRISRYHTKSFNRCRGILHTRIKR